MKLQRQLAMKKAGKAYYKWVVNLPPKTVELMGWKEGTELVAQASKGRLILTSA